MQNQRKGGVYYGGTFAIVGTTDFSQQGQTVVWAGNYTQVFNIDPSAFACGSLTFCANLRSAFGDETFNGSGLSYLLELNGFTWNVQSDPQGTNEAAREDTVLPPIILFFRKGERVG